MMKRAGYFIIYFLIFIVITGGLASVITANLVNQSYLKFQQESDDIGELLQNRIDIYTNLVIASQAFFYSSTDVNRKDFEDFFTATNLPRNYSGVSGVSFTENVKSQNLDSFINSMREELNNPTFDITPKTEKEEYYVIKFTKTESGSIASVGNDISTNPARYETIKTARDSGIPSVTGKVDSITSGSQRTLFVIYAPLYRNGMPLDSVDHRREAIYGVLNVGFATDTVFDKVFIDKDIYRDIHVKIYADDNRTNESLLWEVNPEVSSRRNIIKQSEKIKVADKIWTVELQTSLGYGLSDFEYLLPVISLALGVIISCLLLVLITFLFTSRNRAVDIATQMTQKLREDEKKIQTLVKSLDAKIFSVNKERKITLIEGRDVGILPVNSKLLTGKDIDEVFTDKIQIIEDIDKVLKGNEFAAIRHFNNRDFEISYTAVKENLNVIAAVAIVVDVTERIKSDEILRTKTEELERLNNTMIDRELRMVELKEEIERLKK